MKTAMSVTNPSGKQPASDNPIETLIEELKSLRSDIQELETRYFSSKGPLDTAHGQSARNLPHYLAFRRRDLRQVQEKLASTTAQCQLDPI
jgi:hypothetical protein